MPNVAEAFLLGVVALLRFCNLRPGMYFVQVFWSFLFQVQCHFLLGVAVSLHMCAALPFSSTYSFARFEGWRGPAGPMLVVAVSLLFLCVSAFLLWLLPFSVSMCSKLLSLLRVEQSLRQTSCNWQDT